MPENSLKKGTNPEVKPPLEQQVEGPLNEQAENNADMNPVAAVEKGAKRLGTATETESSRRNAVNNATQRTSSLQSAPAGKPQINITPEEKRAAEAIGFTGEFGEKFVEKKAATNQAYLEYRAKPTVEAKEAMMAAAKDEETLIYSNEGEWKTGTDSLKERTVKGRLAFINQMPKMDPERRQKILIWRKEQAEKTVRAEQEYENTILGLLNSSQNSRYPIPDGLKTFISLALDNLHDTQKAREELSKEVNYDIKETCMKLLATREQKEVNHIKIRYFLWEGTPFEDVFRNRHAALFSASGFNANEGDYWNDRKRVDATKDGTAKGAGKMTQREFDKKHFNAAMYRADHVLPKLSDETQIALYSAVDSIADTLQVQPPAAPEISTGESDSARHIRDALNTLTVGKTTKEAADITDVFLAEIRKVGPQRVRSGGATSFNIRDDDGQFRWYDLAQNADGSSTIENTNPTVVYSPEEKQQKAEEGITKHIVERAPEEKQIDALWDRYIAARNAPTPEPWPDIPGADNMTQAKNRASSARAMMEGTNRNDAAALCRAVQYFNAVNAFETQNKGSLPSRLVRQRNQIVSDMDRKFADQDNKAVNAMLGADAETIYKQMEQAMTQKEKPVIQAPDIAPYSPPEIASTESDNAPSQNAEQVKADIDKALSQPNALGDPQKTKVKKELNDRYGAKVNDDGKVVPKNEESSDQWGNFESALGKIFEAIAKIMAAFQGKKVEGSAANTSSNSPSSGPSGKPPEPNKPKAPEKSNMTQENFDATVQKNKEASEKVKNDPEVYEKALLIEKLFITKREHGAFQNDTSVERLKYVEQTRLLLSIQEKVFTAEHIYQNAKPPTIKMAWDAIYALSAGIKFLTDNNITITHKDEKGNDVDIKQTLEQKKAEYEKKMKEMIVFENLPKNTWTKDMASGFSYKKFDNGAVMRKKENTIETREQDGEWKDAADAVGFRDDAWKATYRAIARSVDSANPWYRGANDMDFSFLPAYHKVMIVRHADGTMMKFDISKNLWEEYSLKAHEKPKGPEKPKGAFDFSKLPIDAWIPDYASKFSYKRSKNNMVMRKEKGAEAVTLRMTDGTWKSAAAAAGIEGVMGTTYEKVLGISDGGKQWVKFPSEDGYIASVDFACDTANPLVFLKREVSSLTGYITIFRYESGKWVQDVTLSGNDFAKIGTKQEKLKQETDTIGNRITTDPKKVNEWMKRQQKSIANNGSIESTASDEAAYTSLRTPKEMTFDKQKNAMRISINGEDWFLVKKFTDLTTYVFYKKKDPNCSLLVEGRELSEDTNYSNLAAQAVEHQKSENADDAKMNKELHEGGFEVASENEPMAYLELSDLSDDLMSNNSRSAAEFPAMLSRRYKVHNGPQDKMDLSKESNPVSAIKARIRDYNKKGVRNFYLQVFAHGGKSGYMAFGDKKITGEQMVEIFKEFGDCKFTVNSSSCYGGGIADAMQFADHKDAEDGRVTVFTQTKKEVVGYSNNKKGKNYTSAYNEALSRALMQGVDGRPGRKLTYGQAHLQADKEARPFLGENAEVYRSRPGQNSAKTADTQGPEQFGSIA